MYLYWRSATIWLSSSGFLYPFKLLNIYLMLSPWNSLKWPPELLSWQQVSIKIGTTVAQQLVGLLQGFVAINIIPPNNLTGIQVRRTDTSTTKMAWSHILIDRLSFILIIPKNNQTIEWKNPDCKYQGLCFQVDKCAVCLTFLGPLVWTLSLEYNGN